MKEYIDLGLPSGTLWASDNEGGYYTYDEAVELFEDNLPTKEQWVELKNECQWEWKWKWDGTNSGCTLTGSNGNSIFLPADGERDSYGGASHVGSNGHYWVSTPNGSSSAWCLYFYSGYVCTISYSYRHFGFSVRLVKK